MSNFDYEREFRLLLNDENFEGFDKIICQLNEIKKESGREKRKYYLPLKKLYEYTRKRKDYCDEHIQILLEELEEFLSERKLEKKKALKRQLRRMNNLKDGLLTVAMHPSRIEQCGLGELFINS